MTERLQYCQSDTSDSARYFSYDSLKAESAKQRLFNATLNNEPCLSESYIDSCNMAELYRDQLYDAVPVPSKRKLNTAEATASSNEPIGKRVCPQYVEDRYQDLEINTIYKYIPETSIHTTIYGQKMLVILKIWSHPQPIILKVINCGLNKEGSQLELMVKPQLIC